MSSLFESMGFVESEQAKPEPQKPKDRTWGEAIEDTGRGLASGAAGLVKSVGDAYGLATGDMDNSARKLGADAQEYWDSGKSQQLKDKQKARQAAVDSADGVAEKAWAAFKSTVTDPALAADAVATNVSTMLPGAVVGKMAYGAKVASGMAAASEFGPVSMAARQAIANTAAKVGTAAAVGTGAVQQGTDVSSDVYDSSMSKPNEDWAKNVDFMAALSRELEVTKDPEQAVKNTKHVFALRAAREAMPTATAISVVANTIPGANILEQAIIGGAAKQTLASSKNQVIKGVLKGAAGGSASEFVEEGGGAAAGNLAKKNNVDPDQDLMEGVGDKAGQGAAGGLLLEAPGGAFHTQHQHVAEKAQEPGSVLSRAAVAGNPGIAAAQPVATTPQQRDDLATASVDLTKFVTSPEISAILPPNERSQVIALAATAGNMRAPAAARQQALDQARAIVASYQAGAQQTTQQEVPQQDDATEAPAGQRPALFGPIGSPVTDMSPPGPSASPSTEAGLNANQSAQARLGALEEEDGQAGMPEHVPTPQEIAKSQEAAGAASQTAQSRLNQLQDEESTQPTQTPAPAGVSVSATPTEVIHGPQATQAQQAAQEGQAQQQSPAVARTLVPAPKVQVPEGSGTALARKIRAIINKMVADGFRTVERREDGNFLVNDKTGEEMRLEWPGSAPIADGITKALIDQEAASRKPDTPAQIEAGNAHKPPTEVRGIPIRIENEAGSTRRGVSPEGKAWESTMTHHYGEIEGTHGRDGDKVDTFIGPNPSSDKVFVVDQRNEDGSFDEHKVMLGFDSEEQARAGYLSNYETGWTGMGAITEMTVPQFKAWVKSPAVQQPAAGYHAVFEGDENAKSDSGTGSQDQGTGAGSEESGGSSLRDTADQSGDGIGRSQEQIAADERSVEQLAKYSFDSSAKAATGTPAADALTTLLRLCEAVFGTHGIAIETNKARDGAYLPVTGHIYVNVKNPQAHVARTIGHELTHSKEKFFEALRNRIWDLISESGKKAYFETYLNKGESYEKATPEQIAKLRDEMLADFFGNRFNDRSWLTQLARQKPALFGDFVRGWIKALDFLSTALKKLTGHERQDEFVKNVDQYIQQIDEAKAIAIEVATKWAEQNKKLAEANRGSTSVALSSRIDEIKELGNFNLDSNPHEIDSLDMVEFLNEQEQRKLQAELANEIAQTQAPVEEAKEDEPLKKQEEAVDDERIKRHGMSAEDAFPAPRWKKAKGNRLQYVTDVMGLYKEGQNARITLDEEPDTDNLYGVGMRGTWVGPSSYEESGWVTFKAAKDFARRFIASKELFKRGFDLATTVQKEDSDRAIDAWKKLNELEGVRRYKDADLTANTPEEIWSSMGLANLYDMTQTMEMLDQYSTTHSFQFVNRATGETQEAGFEVATVGKKKTITAHTTELSRGGMGAAFYQMLAEYAAKHDMQITPDGSLSGINTYRRTEQMLSAAMRTGISNVMVPHETQRVYGFNNNASTEDEHKDNVARLLIASLRNVKEIYPGIVNLKYVPATGAFVDKNGVDAHQEISRILSDVDARAFGLGKATLARAALTQQLLSGNINEEKSASFAEPILYSDRVSTEVQYQDIKSRYEGTPEWMRAPNGSSTKLNERQWIQVRTQNFKDWFGDWEHAYENGGVWAHDNVSKAVDENGEPLVLYHGTDTGGFFSFNKPGGRKRGDIGIFTTPDYGMARSYIRNGRPVDLESKTDQQIMEDEGFEFGERNGKFYYESPYGDESSGFKSLELAVEAAVDEHGMPDQEKQSVVYEVFANIRNPNESDFEGALWSGERDEQYVVEIDDEAQFTEDGRVYLTKEEADELARKVAPEGVDPEDLVKPAPDHYETTDDVAREGAKHGHDGAIIHNVIDDGGGPGYGLEPQDIFVANDPSQLKSADLNTGDFGPSDDIRYSDQEDYQDHEITQLKDGGILVHGDPKTIRSKMPDGIKGRIVADGVQFVRVDAARVRAALDGAKNAYSRAGEIEPHERKNGRYVGAPPGFATPHKMPSFRKMLTNLALEGERGRFWYERSSEEILRMVGGDVNEARKFVALLAIYSPQAKVDTNSTFALRAWAQYKAGQPINVKTRVMDQKATNALKNVDEFWSGEKTGNFFNNLLRMIDPSTEGKQGATIDMWMMRAGQYPNDAPNKGQYAFMEIETNRVAKVLGWEPQQVQAAIWVAMKARMENKGVKEKTEASSEKKGWIKYTYPVKNGKPVKTRVVLDNQKHRDNWIKQAMNHVPTSSDTSAAKFDFADGVMRHIGQVSWEPRPSTKLPILPGVHTAPYEQQVEFQQAVQRALYDSEGGDMIAKRLGLLVDGVTPAPGVWEGDVSAGAQVRMAMPPVAGGKAIYDNDNWKAVTEEEAAAIDPNWKNGTRFEIKPMIDHDQKTLLDAYASILGLLLRQDGVGYHRPFYSGNKSQENGVELDIGRPMTKSEAQELWTAINSRMVALGVADWEQSAGMISSPNGMRVVNFGAIKDNKTFKDLIADAVGDISQDVTNFTEFTSDGNLITNKWLENENGQDYQSRISATGSPDLLGWVRDVLAPRVQSVFNEFSQKYSWGDPGKISFSEHEDTDLSAHGFYSELKKQVEQSSMQQAPAGAWKSFINSLSTKGVKRDEIEWSGVLDWLDLQDGKVRRDAIAQFLDSNGVKVKEVTLGNVDKYAVREAGVDATKYFFTEHEANDYISDQAYKQAMAWAERGTSDDEMDSMVQEANDRFIVYEPGEWRDVAKYHEYTMPGGQNYREVLLTLPNNMRGEVVPKNENGIEGFAVRVNGRNEVGFYEDRAEAEEAASMVGQPGIEIDGVAPAEYRSSHWEQPNVLAHIRVNDRVDADGKKVLFVEEIQSDWGQEGKKKGFKGTGLTQSEEERLNTLRDKLRTQDITSAEREEYGALNLRGAQGASAVPTAPFVTKTEGWLNLALKRILTMAAKDGYDRVAFVNGEQSAARYDLSKKVDQIRYIKNKDGTYEVWASDENGSSLNDTVDKHSLTQSEIEDFVGKDIAKKIVEGQGRNDAGDMVLEGVDLKVGGEGMKAFYDGIVPNALKALLKKAGGEKLVQVRLANAEEDFDQSDLDNATEEELDQLETTGRVTGLVQPGFDVTNAMRDKVLAGMPLFSKRVEQEETPEIQTKPAEKADRFAGKKVEMLVKIEDTGEVATLIMDVNRTLDDYKHRTANVQKLLECL